MARQVKIRRDCLPKEMVRHLEWQGLGWGHDLDCGAFWVRTGSRRGTDGRA